MIERRIRLKSDRFRHLLKAHRRPDGKTYIYTFTVQSTHDTSEKMQENEAKKVQDRKKQQQCHERRIHGSAHHYTFIDPTSAVHPPPTRSATLLGETYDKSKPAPEKAACNSLSRNVFSSLYLGNYSCNHKHAASNVGDNRMH